MFNWLRRALARSNGAERQRFFATIDRLNAEIAGGQPVVSSQLLGRLKLRSGILVLGDPMCAPQVELPHIAANEVEISASLWRYPSGAETVTALRIGLGELTGQAVRRKIGELAIDSAKLVVADKADFDEHWTEKGKDRIGVISTAPDDTVLRLLKKRFKLRTVRVNAVRAEVVGPISEELEAEIDAFLEADPRYADYTFMHFRVQTNNSFDRANHLAKAWDFMPIGNDPEPLMFVCETGRGDGGYDVVVEFAGNSPRELTVSFIDE